MTAWDRRKIIGDALEQRVADELRSRAWVVNPWGQGVFEEGIQRALRRTDSSVRWTPDLVAARGETVCFIDCKANMTGGARRRHAIERAAVRAHLQLVAWTDLPVYYVFDDLGVATPYDVLAAGRRGPTSFVGSGAPYYLISTSMDRPFDTVFGPLQQPIATRAA
ncbi:hypothetical protein ACQP2P_11490 [Dactylosporangium sp. CA-139114]|uniref:hypothetical protein n=1 Tax=Dactylosporangium sp. CA-139114 TaxID=3239931 RepID=UPI003D9893E9